MISHVGKLAGYPLQLTLVNLFGLFFGNINAAHYHAADDSLSALLGGSPGQSFLILVVDVGLRGTTVTFNYP